MSRSAWKAHTSARRRIVRPELPPQFMAWQEKANLRGFRSQGQHLRLKPDKNKSYENATESNLMLRGYRHCLRWSLLNPLPARPIGSATHRGPECEQEGKSLRLGLSNANASTEEVIGSSSPARRDRLTCGHPQAHLQHERFLAGRKRHDWKPQLRIDSGDFQPQRGWMSQTFEIASQGN